MPSGHCDQRAQKYRARGRPQSISESFPSDRGGIEEASPNKRQKLQHTGTIDLEPSQSTLPRPKNMYTFASESNANVIDLTGPSPPSSRGPSSPRRSSNATKPPNFSPHLGTRKLEVRNFRKKTKSDPEQYFNNTWEQLDGALDAIFAHDTRPFSLEELYRGVENVCRQEKAPALFQKLLSKCKNHVTNTIKTILVTNAADISRVDVLRVVIEAWVTWRRQMTTIRSIFFFMDRAYLLHSASQPSIEELGISLFRTHIFSDPILNEKILQGGCDLISNDRRQGLDMDFDSDLFREAVSMFHTLLVYTKHFEPLFLGESQTFFREWADRRRPPSLSLAMYVDACHDLFASEQVRCETFKLDDTTRRDLQAQMETFLVTDQEESLVDIAAVGELMDHTELGSLQRLFSLLQLRSLGEKLRPAFEDYITSKGSEIVFDEAREGEMVIRLLQFKKKLDYMWEHSFMKHRDLGHSLREAFESFINKTKKSSMTWGTDNDKPGEMIAKYVDMILRGGSKAIPSNLGTSNVGPIASNEDDEADGEVDEDGQINKQLDQVLDMFRFVHGKAVFEAFYKKDLAKRLLMSRSASADAEKSMLSRLKSECGASFTHNLEQMFKDIELAREENASYKSMLDERGQKGPVDFNVNVLSASAWPTYPDVPVEVPGDIQDATNEFQKSYKLKHTGRRLEWKHALAHCQMKASFPNGNKELVVSSFQAIVLLYFNGRPLEETIGYSELQQATKLSGDELKRTLQSLACARYRVLSKSPKGKDVNDTDTFVVNPKFSDPKYRIKINQIQLKETKEENKQTHERVAADRQYETQAAIVRIMKAKQKIKHALLVAAVIDATKNRGPVSTEDIKKQIDKLIDKDYMERGDDNTYEYVA